VPVFEERRVVVLELVAAVKRFIEDQDSHPVRDLATQCGRVMTRGKCVNVEPTLKILDLDASRGHWPPSRKCLEIIAIADALYINKRVPQTAGLCQAEI